MTDRIYLDHHSTTPCDRRVAEVMQRMLVDEFGNASSQHLFGQAAAAAVVESTDEMAAALEVLPSELLFTSGATESNTLALYGVCRHPRQRRRKIVTAATEHPAVLDPLARLAQEGFEVVHVPPYPHSHPLVGQVDMEALLEAIDDQTALVSLMWANNEIGTLQPLQQVAERCHQVGALLHCDATQAIGRVPVSLAKVDVDLLSGSAHKFYGPKGVGMLYVRQTGRRVRLRPMIEGGGQQQGLRSGTLNVPGIVAMGRALSIAMAQLDSDTDRIGGLRDRLWNKLATGVDGLQRNGPAFEAGRLAGNLNVLFPGVEGEALMAAVPSVACSSGSACNSVNPEPSHVLLAIGRSEAEARSSLRFGIGRFNTEQEIDTAAERLIAAYRHLRTMLA
ncbi:cysteine desulfurase family protein [Roseimaritima ulvae]|uniref:cysteine desulfurase n=1 Tax=Roseimaritima ulvae TaxID=980254 RepID=A0A5B9QMC6_9BACT|nr:cysteine desulfurase family protein [Roseimaritima ulvae]QEG40148.1 Cysteine desulfurase [Roseimaritima ulvae]